MLRRVKPRAYQVLVKNVDEDTRTHSTDCLYMKIGYIAGDISHIYDDEIEIKEAVQNDFPDAIEYLPLRIPNRQYDRFVRDAQFKRVIDRLVTTFEIIGPLNDTSA